MNWFQLSQDTVHRRASVSTIMNRWVPQKQGTSYTIKQLSAVQGNPTKYSQTASSLSYKFNMCKAKIGYLKMSRDCRRGFINIVSYTSKILSAGEAGFIAMYVVRIREAVRSPPEDGSHLLASGWSACCTFVAFFPVKNTLTFQSYVYEP